MPLLLRFSCPDEETRDKLKGFIEDFYTYDFTGIIHEEASNDESDFEIDIEIDNGNVDLDETAEEEEKSTGPSQNDVIVLD